MTYYVYILAQPTERDAPSASPATRRVFEHRAGAVPGFTTRHGVCRLAHHEAYDDVRDAMARERTLKRWRREWKIALVEAGNPHWHDLYPALNR